MTIAAQLGRALVHFTSAVVLARLLSPADFGLVAMAATAVVFMNAFKDLGLSAAVVQRRDLTADQVTALFWINVLVSGACATAAIAAAPAVAWFYREPRLTAIVSVLAISFVLTGLCVQHHALLRRQMRFGARAALAIVGPGVGITAGIAAAWLGAGYWSLVVLQLTQEAAGAVGAWTVCSWRPGRWRRGAPVRELVAFGSHVMGFNLATYCPELEIR